MQENQVLLDLKSNVSGLELRNQPVVTPAQKRSYVIADNKLALNGQWNEEFLRLELTELKELGANLELIGFNPMEMADITLGKDVDFTEYDEYAAPGLECARRSCESIPTDPR